MSLLRRMTGSGVEWGVQLERPMLLPGHAAAGTVSITPQSGMEIRGCVATLIATEQWKYTETYHSDGRTQTRTVTRTDELQRLPVMLLGPTTLAAGEMATLPFAVPVPPLGPATFEGDVTRLTWELEIKLDVPGLDHSVVVPVIVLQPSGLLSAGVVRLGQFALYEAADGVTGALRYEIELRPMPLCLAAPFAGVIRFAGPPPSRLQEIRLELRVQARATVSSGLQESLLVWQAGLPLSAAGGGEFPIEGMLPATPWPTIELPHGRADATFDVLFARSMARDEHLVRDVALCSTTEI